MKWLEKSRRWLGTVLDKWFPARQVILEVTRHCDRHCTFCYRPPGTNERPGFMSVATAATVLGKLRDRFGRVRVALSGGEPLLHPEIGEIVSTVLSFDPAAMLLSNLGALTASRAADLRARGLQNLQFTFLSIVPAEHDALRGAGDFVRTIEGMKIARNAGFTLSAIVVATSLNLDHFRESLEFLLAMGVTSFMVNRYNAGFQTGSADGRDLFVPADRLAAWLDELETFASRLDLKLPFGVPVPGCALPPGDRPHLHFPPCPVGTGKGEYWAIDADGGVRPCNHFPEPLGNLLSQPVDEIRQGDSWKQMEAQVLKPPPFCSGCDRFPTCRAGCRAAALTWTGDLTREDPWLGILGTKPPKGPSGPT